MSSPLSSVRSILSSRAFLGAWALAGIPAAGMLSHDIAVASVSGSALPTAGVLLLGAQALALGAFRTLASTGDQRPPIAQNPGATDHTAA